MAGDAFDGGVVKDDGTRSAADYRTVTFETPNGAVRAEQRDLGCGVIERGGFLPGADVVAQLAALF